MVPLLCMGIPGNTVAAIFLGGLLVHGISPGPLIFQNSGEYVYGIYLASKIGPRMKPMISGVLGSLKVLNSRPIIAKASYAFIKKRPCA